MSATTIATEALWHDLECGSYAADLPLWSAIATESAGAVLELGTGTGRVALRLAAEGHTVTALERSPALAAELDRRASARGLEIETIVVDAREPWPTPGRARHPESHQLPDAERFAAILAPMQLLHLLGGERGRGAVLTRAAAHLLPGGVLAAAVLAEQPLASDGADPPLPDVRELDGWVYSSLPIEVDAGAEAIVLRRLRQIVSPAGELDEELDLVRLDRLSAQQLEREARACGLQARERIGVPPTADHVGSTICVLERP